MSATLLPFPVTYADAAQALRWCGRHCCPIVRGSGAGVRPCTWVWAKLLRAAGRMKWAGVHRASSGLTHSKCSGISVTYYYYLHHTQCTLWPLWRWDPNVVYDGVSQYRTPDNRSKNSPPQPLPPGWHSSSVDRPGVHHLVLSPAPPGHTVKSHGCHCISLPQFPHWQNAENSSSYITGLQWGLKEMVFVTHFSLCPAHCEFSINITHIIPSASTDTPPLATWIWSIFIGFLPYKGFLPSFSILEHHTVIQNKLFKWPVAICLGHRKYHRLGG